MEMEEKVQLYLKDQDLLLREWYRKQVAHATGIDPGEPTGLLPRELMEGFSSWVDKHLTKLRELICPNIDEIRRAHLAFAMVQAIGRLIKYEEFIGPVLETACLLFIYGVERLCQAHGN